ncbi:MAG TPA: indole-3-glycerol phosphate synthase TrpC, partial [Gemmatimonadaceae bacterium]|nr:indole-3-glycerol phosphate synthase TrpC [Gemmatimonadaceae bacterium]
MQARSTWTPPRGVLGRLCAQARERAAALRPRERQLREGAGSRPAPQSLAAALGAGTDVGIVAELKRRSPSRGTLNAELAAARAARAYVEGGARAISVLTEPNDFGGADEDLLSAHAAVAVPVLRKDFHVDPLQLWEARSLGASAVLLIMRALGPERSLEMAAAAREVGIEGVFEVRDEAELEWALESGAAVIGVNRRNLETLEMSDAVIERLLPAVPPSCVAIAESGVRGSEDVARVAALGA